MSPKQRDSAQVEEPATLEIWRFSEHPGYRRAMQNAGSVAAPLLAGFSLTLLALLVPTLGESTSQSVTVSADGLKLTETGPFSAAPEVAAGFFLLAGLLLIFSVQMAINIRYHGQTPSELAEWYPEYFPQANGEAPHDSAALPEWSTPAWPAVKVGEQWYGGWPRRYLHEELAKANRSATWMRRLYHAGILSLLAGLTALTWPPATEDDLGRIALVVFAGLGFVAEMCWILVVQLTASKIELHGRSPAAFTSDQWLPRRGA